MIKKKETILFITFLIILSFIFLLYQGQDKSVISSHLEGKIILEQTKKQVYIQKAAQDYILVKFKPEISEQKKSEILGKYNLKQKDEIKGISVKIINLPRNSKPEEAVDKLLVGEKDNIEFAEPDFIVEPSFIPNDPYYTSAWHHKTINSPIAWDISRGANITIAILDTGVNCTHVDLSQNCILGWNVVSNNSDTTDINGHGTGVAGTAAEIGNNAIGSIGVAWNAQIMPIRITNDAAGYALYSDIAKGIIYAVDHGAKIASNSYGAYTSATINNAAQYMQSKGGLVTMAAGNQNSSTGNNFTPYIIVVSATDTNDQNTSWTNYGNEIDVAAPGVSIYLTTNGGGYGAGSGTSFSTPLTAGVLALIYSINPQFTPLQAQAILFNSTLDSGDFGWDIHYGWGRIDAAQATILAKNTLANGDTIRPSTPQNLTCNVLQDNKTVTLTWNPSSDNVGIAGYEIYSKGGNFTDVPYNNSTFIPPLSYQIFSVRSFDASGLYSPRYSNSINISLDCFNTSQNIFFHLADTNKDWRIVSSEVVTLDFCRLNLGAAGCNFGTIISSYVTNADFLRLSNAIGTYHYNQGFTCPPDSPVNCWST